MNSYKIDVPVLLIFFSRSDTFAKVFDVIKYVKPSTLLLWQDGPRSERPDDLEGIKKCREIAEQIDWDCKVYKNYQESNLGCDPSTFYSHQWAFSLVDKCIVLEDDFVVTPSFFRYCKELLDRYEFDDRVNHINGFNLLGEYSDCSSDYLFSYNGTGAWASWRRVAKGWDPSYSFLDDKYLMENLRKKYGKSYFDSCYEKAVRHRNTGKAHWESILGFDCMLNNRYAIIPTNNLASNIGMTPGSTHSLTEVSLLPKKFQKIFNNKLHELSFPLKHPQYIVPDYNYMEKVDLLTGRNHPFIRAFRYGIYFFNCIIHGKFHYIINGLKRRFKINH